MKRIGKVIGIILGLVILGALVYYFAPSISSSMNSNLAEAAPSATVADPDAQVFESFVSSMGSAQQYTFSVTKNITGRSSPYTLDVSCTIRGNDYVIKTVQNTHTLRQLYVDGKYTLIDDTAKTISFGVQSISLPDTHFTEALTGRITDINDEIVYGNQVKSIELYKNGTVYVYSFNQQGALVRFYYIFDENEVALDFYSFIIGSCSCSISFDIPALYMRLNGITP